MHATLQDLYFNMLGTVTLMSLSLWAGVGLARSGMRTWNSGLLWQWLGWGLLAVSTILASAETVLFIAGVVALAIGVSWLGMASAHYCQKILPHAWTYGPATLAAMIGLFDAGSFESLAFVDGIFGMQLIFISWLILPKVSAEMKIRWRWLAAGSFGLSGFMSFVPLTLGLLAQFSIEPTDPRMGYATVVLINNLWPIVNIVCTMAILLAHRDEAEQALRRIATLDALTGLLNRGAVMKLAQSKLERSMRSGTPFSVLIFDLDHFKQINDNYGHPAGDAVLKTFSQLLSDSVRPDDLAGRYGGEEFCLFVPADIGVASAIQDRLKADLRRQTAQDLPCPVTFSVGAATFIGGMSTTLDTLIKDADDALYKAKRAGRDRMIVHEDEVTAHPASEAVGGAFSTQSAVR